MKFKFTIQPYQTEAVESVTRVFAGQGFASPLSYRRDVPQAAQTSLFGGEAGDDFTMAFANALVELDAGQMLTNINPASTTPLRTGSVMRSSMCSMLSTLTGGSWSSRSRSRAST